MNQTEFKHISVLLDETIEGLNIKPDGIYVDGTMGGAGHGYEVCKRLGPDGRYIGIDRDEAAIAAGRQRLSDFEDKVSIVRGNYSSAPTILKELNIDKVDGIMLDLGVSSHQLDVAERGFSYKVEGPLDLRMNPLKGVSAAQRLKEVTQEELEGMLIENADEPYAAEIAETVMKWFRNGKAIETTSQMKQVIEQALVYVPKAERDEAVKKSCARTFQALRIDVNSEFEVLYSFLEKLPDVMAPGGRAAILTFHSGEDRLVKKAFKDCQKAGIFSEVSKDVIRPSAEECNRNPRAKSTKMRWAIKA